jgi:hypothetical protein
MLTSRLSVCALLMMCTQAAADGESTPMFGVAVVGGEESRTPDHVNELAGVGFDLAWWHGRFGLGAEGSARWNIDSDGRALVLGGSARFRLLDTMVPALMDSRPVEVALELQAIVEREWWSAASSAADPTSHGLGLVLRVRGGGEPEGSSVLAESRFFLRVMTARWEDGDVVARTDTTTMPVATTSPAMTVLLGIGASFGGGTSSYMYKFRSRPSVPAVLW